MSRLYSPSTYERPEFMDCPLTLEILDDPDFTAELKQDGLFGIGICVEGNMSVYSSAFEPKGILTINPSITAVFIGEYMYGSNWAFRHNEVGFYHIFDIVAFGRYDLRDRALSYRRALLDMLFRDHIREHPVVKQNQVFSADLRDYLWSTYVEKQDYEGLVFKKSTESYTNACWYRSKKVFTVEYICMGFNEGAGKNHDRVGSIQAGVFKNGALTPMCSVGGGMSDQDRIDWWANPSQHVGKVFTASGYKIFETGALRHPVFKGWRDDKRPEDVTFTDLMKHAHYMGKGG